MDRPWIRLLLAAALLWRLAAASGNEDDAAAAAAYDPAAAEAYDPAAPVVLEDDTLAAEERVVPPLDTWVIKQAEGIGGSDVAVILEDAFTNFVDTERTLETSLAARMEGLISKDVRGQLSSVVAYMIIVLPIVFLSYLSFIAGKMVSLRQYVLIGNLCNLGFVSIVFVWYLISGDDPVELMVVLNPKLVIFIQMVMALQFPAFCILLVAAVLVSVTKKQKMYFIFQLVLYFAMALDYRKRIWKPTLLKQIFESQTIFAYMIYLVILSFMTYLTVRSAKADRTETLVTEVEAVMSNVQRSAAEVVMEAVDPNTNTTDTDKIN